MDRSGPLNGKRQLIARCVVTLCLLNEACRDNGQPELGYEPTAELIHGFETVEMDLRIGRDMTGTHVSVTAPRGSRILNCGLFVAPPRIEDRRIVRCPASLWRLRSFR